MRISCENCKAAYLVTAKIIGTSGRLVKCAKCSHVWLAKPPAEQLYFLSNQEQANLPVVFKPSFPSSFKLIPILLGLMILIMSVTFFADCLIKYSPFQTGYELFLIHDSDDLFLHDFSIAKEEKDLIVKGKISNNSLSPKMLPRIRYTVMDENKNIIAKYTKDFVNKSFLNPGEEKDVKAKIIGMNAKYVKIDIGNKLDLLLRN